MKLFIQLLLLLTPMYIFSQSSIELVEKSKKIDDEITLIFQNKELNYYIDSDSNNPKTLTKEDYFQITSEEFRLYSEFLNPLEYRYNTSTEELEDELYQASQDFLNTAVSYLTDLRSISPESIVENFKNENEEYTLEPELLDIYIYLNDHKYKFDEEPKTLEKEMKELDFYETRDSISKDYNVAFKSLKSISTVPEINEVLKKNNSTFKAHDQLLSDLDFRYKTLKNTFSKINYEQLNNSQSIKALVQTKLNKLNQDYQTFLKTRKELEHKYNNLKKLFEDLTLGPKNNDSRFRISKLTQIDRKKRYEVSINLEKLNFDEDNKSISVEEKYSWKIHIRRYRTFIPVVSSGVFYSNLSFNQYGTDEDSEGNTIISQTTDKENEITTGAYLNLYLNPIHDFPVFAQLGVGPSKEKPLFFIGGGFEVLDRISISSGMVFTWFPELNELSIGDNVTGTSAIEEDITYSFDTNPKFYIGINFNITEKDKE